MSHHPTSGRLPPAAFLIIGFEFCERFAFYSMLVAGVVAGLIAATFGWYAVFVLAASGIGAALVAFVTLCGRLLWPANQNSPTWI